jgi:ceramide glucosyltransferase
MTHFIPVALGVLAGVSLALTLWQWFEAVRFPLHRPPPRSGFAPPLTLLKPLKGADPATEDCLRSWLAQDYPGPLQILFGVADADDPVVPVVQRLLAEFTDRDARLLVCRERAGRNAKVSTLRQLEPRACHPFLVLSDADVWAPPDFLEQVVAPFQDAAVGLVNPFYGIAGATDLATRWEALAVNADFWPGVLQSRRLRPLGYGLGAAIAVRRSRLEGAGGFAALADLLADDFELGRRVAAQGARIRLCPVVVECREAARGWGEVWRHQLRWARTIRVCMPGPYAASILSNATLWPLAWALAQPGLPALVGLAVALVVRMIVAADCARRLTRSAQHLPWFWLAPVKDLLQVLLWLLAFAGNTVEWRAQRFRVTPRGELEPLARPTGRSPDPSP